MGLVGFHRVGQTFTRDGVQSTALKGLELDIAEGEFYCLLGPSGCGKTTALNLLAGFEVPTEGEVRIAGEPVRGPGADRGVVFQTHDSLFDWLTALENVEFGLRMRGAPAPERRRAAEAALALVGLAAHAHKRPHELSGGMKQRVQIARVIANRPRMMLMDEPFGALDAQTRRVLQRELSRIWERERLSVLFITHDIEEAITLGTRVGVMHAGPASRIKATIAISPQARADRASEAFMRHYREIHDLIEVEVGKTLARELHEA